MEKSLPNFYAIIPATVRYCKELEPMARLLYGEITALASREGYCWASNGYFSDLYDVDDRTIRRWINSLKENNFIVVEIEKEGFHTTRKIWISPEIQNSFARGQKCPDGRTKMSGGEDKNVRHINTPSNTDEKTVCPSGAVAPSESLKKVEKIGTDGNKRSLEKDEVIKKMLHQMPEATMGEIEEAWQVLVGYTGRVNDLMQFIFGTVKNLKAKKNIEKLQTKEKECPPTCEIPPVKVLTLEEIALRQQHAQKLFSEYLTKP